MAKFSLAWDAHNKNICEGLTALQQNGEFVDMTLAADGHHVKVHQMVISLASPYLKEVITSLQSTHPVIFLTKISFPVLSAILEYIYTGEVLIEKDSIQDLIEAAQELKIKGLEEMKYDLPEQETITKPMISKSSHGQPLSEYLFNEKQNLNESEDQEEYTYTFLDEGETETEQEETEIHNEVAEKPIEMEININNQVVKVPGPQLQYTISNMGALQMILNRCIYSLRYTSVKGPEGHRQWRCIDYNRRKCPAGIISKGGVILKRFGAHNHTFHDKKILKKVRDGAVYSEIQDAESICKRKPGNRRSQNKC